MTVLRAVIALTVIGALSLFLPGPTDAAAHGLLTIGQDLAHATIREGHHVWAALTERAAAGTRPSSS